MAKKLYLFHLDALDVLSESGRVFDEMSDKELVEVIKNNKDRVLSFSSMKELVYQWNNKCEDMFDPDFSFMRIMEDVNPDPNIKRIDEFGQRMDALLKEFNDVDEQDLADSLDYYASDMQSRANRN